MTTEKILAEWAHRGAELLDRVQPGWCKGVRTDNLVMGTDTDIPGQLYGSFNAGMAALGLHTTREYVRCGFLLGINARAYAALTEAWKQEIQQREEDAGYV